MIRRAEAVMALEPGLVDQLRSLIQHLLPMPGDEEAYVGDSLVVPPSSEVTVTYRFSRSCTFYVKKVYVDAAAGCTYTWTAEGCRTPSGGEYVKTMWGNEHEFDLPLVIKPGGALRLTVTNPTEANYLLDVVIRAWARRVV